MKVRIHVINSGAKVALAVSAQARLPVFRGGKHSLVPCTLHPHLCTLSLEFGYLLLLGRHLVSV